MFRALSLFVAAACLISTALAEDKQTAETHTTRTVLSAADYENWQKKGFSRQDIQYAYSAAHASNRSVDDIFGMRKNGRTWEEIARELRVPADRIYSGRFSAMAGERTDTRAAGGRSSGRVDERVRGTRDTTRTGGGSMGGGGMDRMRDGQGHLPGHMGYPVYERPLPGRFYRERLRMTPADYVRIRNMGFTRDQTLMIANLRWETGLEYYVFSDALWRGEQPLDIARRFNLSRFELTTVRPEWRTPEWAEAVGESRFDAGDLRLW